VSRNRGFLKKRATARVGASKDGPLGKLLLRIVDGGLAGCIFVVPMIMGGRQALGRMTLATLSVAVALAWALRQSLGREWTWRRSSAEWLILAGVVLLIVQTVSLPPALLERLTPHVSEILPLWGPQADSSAALGVWSQVSLTPAATRAALVIFVAYSLLFLVTVQRIRVVDDVERILRWCALSALLMAACGLAQLFAGNGKFFWVYEHVYADTYGVATGAFTNRNHFAHFLALGIGPLIWWVQDGLRRRRREPTHKLDQSAGKSQAGDLGVGLRLIAMGIVLFALLLSLSRGGALAALLATSICVAVCYRASSVGLRFVGGLAAVALLIGASLAIFGYERVSNRLDDFTSASLETLDMRGGRRAIWGAVAKAIPDYALLGSGVGSHREVYPMYLERSNSLAYYSHAECGYLQVALEAGSVGLGLLLTGIGVCGFWCVSALKNAGSRRLLVCVGAVCAGLAANAAHSLVDFVWYVPGCMAIVAILAGCACRLRQLAVYGPFGRASECHSDGRARRARSRLVKKVPRPVGLMAVALLVAVGGWMIHDRAGPVVAEPHWERFLTLSRDLSDPLPFGSDQLDGSSSDHQAQYSLAVKQRMVAELEEVVRWDPHHARAHLRLAETYIRLFHHKQQTSPNVMSLCQIRDAVIQSQSDAVPPERRLNSREALEQWLSRAIGDHYRYLDLALHHSCQGLTSCPLLGEGYLFLGDLAFLKGWGASTKSACVAQALKVRPYDGTVLFQAGNEAVLAGRWEQGLAFWQQSFRSGPVHQKQIIDWLANHIHPEDLQAEIQFLIETFQPDLTGLRLLERRYREIARPEQMAALRRAYARAVEAEAEAEAESSNNQSAAVLWLEAMSLYSKLDAPTQGLRCGRNALRCDPNSCRVRKMLAYCLAGLGQFAEAKEHLDWCLKRKPGDKSLRGKMEEIVEKETRRQARTAAISGKAGYHQAVGRHPDTWVAPGKPDAFNAQLR